MARLQLFRELDLLSTRRRPSIELQQYAAVWYARDVCGQRWCAATGSVAAAAGWPSHAEWQPMGNPYVKHGSAIHTNGRETIGDLPAIHGHTSPMDDAWLTHRSAL